MAPSIRTRVWRNGTLEAENFPFEQVSDYLDQPDTLVWADLLAPEHEGDDAGREARAGDEVRRDQVLAHYAALPAGARSRASGVTPPVSIIRMVSQM